MRAAIRWVLVWASKLTWFLYGWLISAWFQCGRPKLTWFHCGGSNLTWSRFRDRELFGLCVAVEYDLVLVSGSKFTWILCYVRPPIDMESWQINVLVVFCNTFNWVAQWFILYKRKKRSGLQILARVDWVAPCFIRHKRTEARGSKSHRSRSPFFFSNAFSEIHLRTTARP